jgi:hypothetical protein
VGNAKYRIREGNGITKRIAGAVPGPDWQYFSLNIRPPLDSVRLSDTLQRSLISIEKHRINLLQAFNKGPKLTWSCGSLISHGICGVVALEGEFG